MNDLTAKHGFNSFWGVVVALYMVLLIYVAKFDLFAQIITRGVTPLLLLMVFFRFGFRGKELPREFYLWLLFVLWSFTGLFFTQNNTLFWRYEQLLIGNLMLMFIIYTLQLNQWIFNHLLLGIILGSLAVLVDSFIGSGNILASLSNTGVTGVTGNPNSFGFLMLLGIISTVFFWEYRDNRYRWVLLVLMFLFTLGILLSASRKNFLTLGIFVFLWIFYCYRSKFNHPVRFFGMLIIFIGIGYWLFDYILANTYLGLRISLASEESSNPKRLMLYQEGWEMFKNNPFYGVGLGNFSVNSRFGTFSHSDLMELLATTGLPGVVLYLMIYRSLWKRAKRMKAWVTNNMDRYRINLVVPVVISLLFLGIGATIFTDIIIFSLIVAIIGYLNSMENFNWEQSTSETVDTHLFTNQTQKQFGS